MQRRTHINVSTIPAIAPGTLVGVYTDEACTILATIYDDAGATKTNPLTVDVNGEFYYRAVDGKYYERITGQPVATLVFFDSTEALYLAFDSTPAGVPTAEGIISWTAADHTLEGQTGLGGVVIQYGQELLLLGYNNTGTPIADGTPVSLDGSSGLRPIIYPTDPTDPTACRCFVGITTMEIPAHNQGFVCRSGLVRGINTSAFEEGDRLWVSGIGTMANVEPATGERVRVGMVLTKSANGLIYSNPQHFELTYQQELLIDNLPSDSVMPAGFPNRTDSTLAFDDTSHVFTIAPAASSFSFYSVGKRFTKSVAQTFDLDNVSGGLGTNALHYVYFDASGALVASKSAWSIHSGHAMVAIVWWNGTNGAIFDERHGIRDLWWHTWAHLTIGTRYETGGALTRPSATNDLQLELTSVEIWDEDLERVTTAAEGKLCRLVRETSAGVYTWINGTNNAGYDYPVFWNAGATQVQYNRQSDYSLQDASDTQFVPYYIYATPDVTRPLYVYTPTIGVAYATIAAARNAPVPPNFVPEMKLLYRFIYRGDGEFQESLDYRTATTVPGGGTGSIAASSVILAPVGGFTSTNVQAGFGEAQTLTAQMLAKTSTYTLTGADNGKIVHCDGTFTITLPRTATEDVVDGYNCIIWNIGTGTITLAIESGDTLTSTATTIATKKAAIVWKKTDTAWYAAGGLG